MTTCHYPNVSNVTTEAIIRLLVQSLLDPAYDIHAIEVKEMSYCSSKYAKLLTFGCSFNLNFQFFSGKRDGKLR